MRIFSTQADRGWRDTAQRRPQLQCQLGNNLETGLTIKPLLCGRARTGPNAGRAFEPTKSAPAPGAAKARRVPVRLEPAAAIGARARNENLVAERFFCILPAVVGLGLVWISRPPCPCGSRHAPPAFRGKAGPDHRNAGKERKRRRLCLAALRAAPERWRVQNPLPSHSLVSACGPRAAGQAQPAKLRLFGWKARVAAPITNH
jgi:hypothetical protein